MIAPSKETTYYGSLSIIPLSPVRVLSNALFSLCKRPRSDSNVSTLSHPLLGLGDDPDLLLLVQEVWRDLTSISALFLVSDSLIWLTSALSTYNQPQLSPLLKLTSASIVSQSENEKVLTTNIQTLT